jgi:NitT/TauT family transport system substrate-binding protein
MDSGQQGYVTSEPFAVMKEGGFEPTVFLMYDAGYTTYSTMIEGMADYVSGNPDITKRFVEASIIGWYNYLYGDNKAANELIKKDNPDMTDEQIAYSIEKLKEYGIADSGDAETLGIGAMTEARWTDFFALTVEAGLFPEDLDLSRAYTLDFIDKGVGLEMKKELTGG